MLATEQNPKALGKIVPQLDLSGAKGCFTKTQFSMCIPEVSLYTSQIPLIPNIYLFHSF